MTSTDLQSGCAVFDPWASNAAPISIKTLRRNLWFTCDMGRREAWRHLTHDPGMGARPSRGAQGMGFQAGRSPWLLRQRPAPRPIALPAAKGVGEHGSI